MSGKKNRKLVKRKIREGRSEKCPESPPKSKQLPFAWEAMRRARGDTRYVSRKINMARLIHRSLSGEKNAPLYYVRWIGAYRNICKTKADYLRSIQYELSTPGTEKPFAISTSVRALGKSRIGLRVDMSKSKIARVYASDAYTIEDENGVVKSVYEKAMDTRLGLESNTVKAYYREGVGLLQYDAVIVERTASSKTIKMARQIGASVGLPVVIAP
jgi:hypothetical protein